MNFLFRLLLTLNSTSWVIVVYGIKEKWSIWNLPYWVFCIFLLLAPVALSVLSIIITGTFSKDDLNECKGVQSANIEYLAVYLSYLFVGLGIEDGITLVFVYTIIFVFSLVSQSQYFNPLFLLFGFKFYHITTASGSKVFLITKADIRNPTTASFKSLRRINNTTYIVRGHEKR